MELNNSEDSLAKNMDAPGKMMRGAEILLKCLQAENVKHIWGYPGGAALHIYDAIFKQTIIEHILVRHEQGAVHAADGFARSTGEVGVAVVTSGPGATNAVTGIATAHMDSIPLVVITAQVPSHAIGEDAFQECDTVGMTRPIVKHNFLVKDPADIVMVIKKAFHIARSGRPGPVVVDLPKDVTFAKALFTGYPDSITMRSYNPKRHGHPGQIRKALHLLMNAKRPYVYSGGGIIQANASEELRELLRLLPVPSTSTLMGLGAIPASDPNFLGMLGMHGTYEANHAMQACDVLLAVGARFDDRVIGNTKHFLQADRKIIHIDVDPSSIGKRVHVDVPIVGDVKLVLQDMIDALNSDEMKLDYASIDEWQQQIATWRKKNSLYYALSKQGLIKPQYVVERLSQLAQGEDCYVSSDVGQHQMWAAQYFKFEEPRRWLNSGGLGTMGVGIPYAMGAKLAHPQADVYCITGEGSVQMCIQELSTCLQYGTHIKIVSLNNGFLGMVRQWQELDYNKRYSHSYMTSLPDFVKLAEAYGHIGMRIERHEDVDGALHEMRKIKDRTVFMDFQTDPTENVFPMVKAGRGINEMLLGVEEL
jgi:acetolactate synthase I/II/III large subunit